MKETDTELGCTFEFYSYSQEIVTLSHQIGLNQQPRLMMTWWLGWARVYRAGKL